MMSAKRVALVALVLLALPSALAAKEEKVAPPSSYEVVDGVAYYLLAGDASSSFLASNPGSGDRVMDFTGCAFVQLRPELDRGRISIAGLVDGITPVRVELGEFNGNVAGQGPIASNVTLDQTLHPVLPAGKAARAEVAGEAIAVMKAAEVFDPIASRLRLANFTDPVGGGEELRATLAVAKDGIRDDATGALLAEVVRDDGELHIVLSSPEGASPQVDEFRFSSPSAFPDDSAPPDAEYTRTHQFLNTRFGGHATVTVSLQSKAPPGFNALTVVVRAPDGSEAANATVDSSALSAGAATLEFPADQMGMYDIAVTGKMLMGRYTLDVALAAPPAFQLDFWWEDVARGAAAPNAYGECQKEIGLRAQVVAGTVDRARPPGFPLEVIVLSIAAAAATLLLVLKLVIDQVSSDAFRKQFKK